MKHRSPTISRGMDDRPWVCHQRSGKSKRTEISVVSLSLRLLTKADELLHPSEVRANHRVPHIHIQLLCMDYDQNKCLAGIFYV